jgi:membrane-associated phospholipid phosphatase
MVGPVRGPVVDREPIVSPDAPVVEPHRASPSVVGATDPVLWGFAAALLIGAGVIALHLQWSVVWKPVYVNGAGVLMLVAIGVFYDLSGRSAALARVSYAVALATTLGYATLVTTYILGGIGRPFQSELLRQWDAFLGFSWPKWFSWVAAHPSLQTFLACIYAMHLAATATTVFILALRTRDGATRFLRAFCLAFAAVALGELLLPSFTNTPNAPSNLVRLSLRDGTFGALDISRTVGLVCFPSMHAVLGVLVPTALWLFRAWRVPLMLYGVGMCVASLSEGGHHLVDVLAGAIVAFAVTWVTRLMSAQITTDG